MRTKITSETEKRSKKSQFYNFYPLKFPNFNFFLELSLRSTHGHIWKSYKDANKDEIAIASDDGNILIYSANQINSTKPIVLKFKEEINAIITLGWGSAPNLDVIGIGSSESIQVYNAFENVSIFYKKIDDGLR